MDEKKVYAVYVDLLRLHKAYHGKIPSQDVREQFIQAINAINSKRNTCFCYSMCEALRKWFWRAMEGLEAVDIPNYYADLWHFHHEYLGKVKTDEDYEKICKESHALSYKYCQDECKAMILAIVADLDANNQQ